MRKFFIVDPSLSDERGHHFDLSERIARSAYRQGYEVHILCNVAFSSQFSDLTVEVWPVFEFSNYDHDGDKDKTRQNFARQLQSIFLKSEATSNDIVLCHTCDARIYECALSYFEVYSDALPLHLATPYDEAVMPGNEPSDAVAITVGKLAYHAAGKVFFWAETLPLANHLTARWNVRVEPLLLPSKNRETDTSTLSPVEPREPLKFAYLGAAREEKGFHLLPDILEAVLQDHRNDRARFFIQCSPQIVGYSPTISKAVDRLKAIAGDRVELQGETLKSEEYDQVFFSCDALLLPYDLEKYRRRGSGIAWDGASCGKVLITRDNTVAASFTTREASVLSDSILGWIEGIAGFCLQPEKYKQAAHERASYLQQISSPGRYLSRLECRGEREMRALQSPSAILGSPLPLLARKLPEVI